MVSPNSIESLRKARGWSRPQLGQRMGTSGQQVERLEKGQRKLSHEWIEKAAEALGVSTSAIIAPPDDGGLDLPDLPDRRRAADDDETVEITQLDLSFSMGPGTTLEDYIEETKVRFDLGYIRSFTRTTPTRLHLAKGVGESMFPTLVSSDLVWIDTTQTMLNQQDRIWAISLFGAAAIKRLRTMKGGKVLVISDNPAVENQEVDAEDLMIGGRVIRFARDL